MVCLLGVVQKLTETQSLVDIDLFTDIRRIEGALQAHSCTEALAWCSENKVALRKIKVSQGASLLSQAPELTRRSEPT